MKTLFLNIGLGEKEMQAWLKMLELGAQPVSVIAKCIDVPRSSMYAILERLKKLQVVEKFTRNGMIYIKCIPIRSLIDLLKSRERTIENTLDLLQQNLPKLEALENKLSITPAVRFLEGKEGIARLYEEILKEKEFYALFNPELVKRGMPEYLYKVPEELRKKNGKAKEILVDCSEAHRYKKRFQSKLHAIKILPKKSVFFSDTILCENKIYMIAYGENQISATEIINSSLAQTQRIIFQILWERI